MVLVMTATGRSLVVRSLRRPPSPGVGSGMMESLEDQLQPLEDSPSSALWAPSADEPRWTPLILCFPRSPAESWPRLQQQRLLPREPRGCETRGWEPRRSGESRGLESPGRVGDGAFLSGWFRYGRQCGFGR